MRMSDSSARAASDADLARIAQFNDTATAFADDVTLQELIEARVATQSEATAVICDHDPAFGAATLSYAQLNRKANQLAHLLRAQGVGPGQVVALAVERSFAMIIGILGILKAGGAYLPVSPQDPAQRISYLLSDGGARLLLVQGAGVRRLAFGGRVVNLDDPGSYRGSAANPPIENSPQDLAYL